MASFARFNHVSTVFLVKYHFQTFSINYANVTYSKQVVFFVRHKNELETQKWTVIEDTSPEIERDWSESAIHGPKPIGPGAGQSGRKFRNRG